MNKEIYILEGGTEDDWKELTDKLKNQYSCTTFTNLYKEPEKLRLLQEYEPWGIFIGTTGIGHDEERKELRKQFLSINYIPEAIIFATEPSALTYADIARNLKQKYGTTSYFIDIFDGELIEISWI